ncbi:low molecular weight protein-tyrosine-phosphatase [Leucobacter chromiireducens]|uniref:protein-tyrosine-phosphatase n=1 Tax=Leucobacter chromiireducens subsp. chromiireducens TaxID=660067 RepID=A0ABS1SJZ0_9MICO|nr:low molecular weight protein-tyrosine-phosphatase [Leucobacter chromiireducens]MBL3688484.1 low molecular weight phosphotyrosine protein phosphatase [Leucobacter chromiireducens subsp. chromiireducens]
MSAPFHVNFVCTGNICRSPMAEVVFQELTERAGIASRFSVRSSGTEAWHTGKPADPRTVTALAARGFDGSAHRASQVSDAEIAGDELLVALARGHRDALLARGADPARVVLFTDFDPSSPADPDVFDPYYDDQAAFDGVLEQVERGAAELLTQLRLRLGF